MYFDTLTGFRKNKLTVKWNYLIKFENNKEHLKIRQFADQKTE